MDLVAAPALAEPVVGLHHALREDLQLLGAHGDAVDVHVIVMRLRWRTADDQPQRGRNGQETAQ